MKKRQMFYQWHTVRGFYSNPTFDFIFKKGYYFDMKIMLYNPNVGLYISTHNCRRLFKSCITLYVISRGTAAMFGRKQLLVD